MCLHTGVVLCTTSPHVKAIMDVLAPVITSPNPFMSAGLFHLGGGAVLDQPVNATAFANRDALCVFAVQCTAGVTPSPLNTTQVAEAQYLIRTCSYMATQVLR